MPEEAIVLLVAVGLDDAGLDFAADDVAIWLPAAGNLVMIAASTTDQVAVGVATLN